MKNWVPNLRPPSDDIGLSSNAALLADELADVEGACSTCLFFDLDEDNSDGSGLCRRFPPVMSQLDREARFPVVPKHCFCGEWHLAPISCDD